MNNTKKFETQITAEQAFKNLRLIIDYAKSCGGKKISDEQIQYCEEWLFDCVHCTGYCPISTPVDIFNASFEEFEEENN
jgi:hypothetical protein